MPLYESGRKADLARNKKRRIEFLTGKECLFCGEDWVPRLTLLHRDSPRKHLPDGLWQSSDEKREAALSEAIVVCRGCRAIKTGVAKNLKRRRGPRADAVPLS